MRTSTSASCAPKSGAVAGAASAPAAAGMAATTRRAVECASCSAQASGGSWTTPALDFGAGTFRDAVPAPPTAAAGAGTSRLAMAQQRALVDERGDCKTAGQQIGAGTGQADERRLGQLWCQAWPPRSRPSCGAKHELTAACRVATRRGERAVAVAGHWQPGTCLTAAGKRQLEPDGGGVGVRIARAIAPFD